MALFGVLLVAGLGLGGFYYYKKIYLPQKEAQQAANQVNPQVQQQAGAPQQVAAPPVVAAPEPAPPAPLPTAVAPAASAAPKPAAYGRNTPAAHPAASRTPAPEPAQSRAPVYASPAPQPAEPARVSQAPPAAPQPQSPPPQQPARQEIPQPEPRPAPPATPAEGVIVWSGKLEKNASITIDGGSASLGTLHGALPGVPVMVEITPASDVGVVESPAPSNSWRRIVLRSRVNRNTVVTVKWRALGR